MRASHHRARPQQVAMSASVIWPTVLEYTVDVARVQNYEPRGGKDRAAGDDPDRGPHPSAGRFDSQLHRGLVTRRRGEGAEELGSSPTDPLAATVSDAQQRGRRSDARGRSAKLQSVGERFTVQRDGERDVTSVRIGAGATGAVAVMRCFEAVRGGDRVAQHLCPSRDRLGPRDAGFALPSGRRADRSRTSPSTAHAIAATGHRVST